MTGNGCTVAVPKKLDMKIQFKHNNDPKMGGGKRKKKTKNLYYFTKYCSDTTDCFAYSKPWVQLEIM